MRRLLFFAVALALAGCDGVLDDDLDAQVVVSASLGAGDPLPTVFLSRVSPLLDAYDPDALAISGAVVTVTLLAPDGSDEQTVEYIGGGRTGYVPAERPTVLPGRTYRLDAAVGDERLTAQTTVPRLVELVAPPPASVALGDGQGPEVRVTRTSTAERPARFVLSTKALAPVQFREVTVGDGTFFRSLPAEGRFFPTPVYQRFLDCETEPEGTLLCEQNPDDVGIDVGTSPVLNEASYRDVGGGAIAIQVPFLAFGYYGPTEIQVTSVDQALEDFVEGQAVQGGGTTLSPGEIPNIETNVTGGLGVFGSFSRVTVLTELTER